MVGAARCPAALRGSGGRAELWTHTTLNIRLRDCVWAASLALAVLERFNRQCCVLGWSATEIRLRPDRRSIHKIAHLNKRLKIFFRCAGWGETAPHGAEETPMRKGAQNKAARLLKRHDRLHH